MDGEEVWFYFREEVQGGEQESQRNYERERKKNRTDWSRGEADRPHRGMRRRISAEKKRTNEMRAEAAMETDQKKGR